MAGYVQTSQALETEIAVVSFFKEKSVKRLIQPEFLGPFHSILHFAFASGTTNALTTPSAYINTSLPLREQ